MEQLNIFENDITKVDVSQLQTLTFDDWKRLGNTLDISNDVVINDYYSHEYNEHNPPYYHCLPLFNTITKDSSYKFLIITMGDDELFVAYKVISIIKTKLIKIFDKPISLNRNSENEKIVIDTLEQMDYFKFTYKEKYAHLFSRKGEISHQDCDYYFDFNIQKEKYTHKYFAKNHFNRFYKDDFKIEMTNQMDLQKLSNLRKTWEQTKVEQGVDITTKLDKFNKVMKKLNGSLHCLFLNIYYKGELVLNHCFLVYPKFVANIYRSSISRTSNNPDEDSWLRNTFSRLDKFAVYVASSNLYAKNLISMIYYGGAHPSNKSLMKYKQTHSNGCITYYTHNGGLVNGI